MLARKLSMVQYFFLGFKWISNKGLMSINIVSVAIVPRTEHYTVLVVPNFIFTPYSIDSL